VSARNPSSPLSHGAWLLRTPGFLVGFLWGFAEGTLFFIIPDLVITFTALFSLKQSLKQLGAVLAGSLLGGWLIFTLAARDYPATRRAVGGVPFVTPRMFEATQRNYESSGLWTLGQGPLSGIPYKVFAVEAPAHASLLPFLLASIPGRLGRLALPWALFAAAGFWLKRRIAKQPLWAIAAHAVFWIAVYAYYWSVVR
jgi:hypothetical protein